MLIVFWIVAALAALAFLAAGFMKLFRPAPALKHAGMGWVDDFAPPVVKLIGLAEVVGALGLVLPPLTGIAAVLSPIAGLCLVALMFGAIVVHIRRHESVVAPIVLAIVALATAILGFIVVVR
ncbi:MULTISPECIES: DoxX family protein [Subtercola]|uniref:DoxX family protein n=1 Tax=Subtercola vilae TaxID=2056433 RepID=A0A4T2BN12_9MICO|nr:MULTISPECIES: DoxX family protein [Subtercola]MEA9986564.1 DoxX family protein [Subtercola sp. RTI3]TIH32062.1 DoxX family protein [Subtercola vilae]